MVSRQVIDMKPEKDLAIGCIVSTQFLRDIRPILQEGTLLQSPYIRTLVRWCLDYFNRYEKAPEDLIQDIFESKKETTDDEYIENIEKLLIHLNSTYLGENTFNAPYYFDESERYLKTLSLKALMSNITGLLSQGKVEEAEAQLAVYKRVEASIGVGVDLFHDDNLLDDIFNVDNETLFHIPGAFGEAIKNIHRGDIAVFGAPSKRGKTFFLTEMSKYAAMENLNILFLSLEMNSYQIAKRIYQNLLGESSYKMKDYAEIAKFDKERNIVFEDIKKGGLDKNKTKKFRDQFRKQIRGGRFKIFDPISGGCSVEDICITLDNLAYYDDFVPDVIVLDYADIMEKDKDMRGDPLQITNEIYLRLKREIAQKRNCLVITASQHNRSAVNSDAEIGNIAGSIRKFDHTSHWISLNQSKVEKKIGLMRISVQGRHDDFSSLDEVVCLQGLNIGRPILDSEFKSKIGNYDEIIKEMEE